MKTFQAAQLHLRLSPRDCLLFWLSCYCCIDVSLLLRQALLEQIKTKWKNCSHTRVWEMGAGLFHKNKCCKFCISFSWNLVMRTTIFLNMGKPPNPLPQNKRKINAPQLGNFQYLIKRTKMWINHEVILKWKELVVLQ